MAGINPTCIDPASGGTASTFYENVGQQLHGRVRGPERRLGDRRPTRARSPSTPAPCRPTATRPSPPPPRAARPAPPAPRDRAPPRSTSSSAPWPTPRPASDAGSYPLTFTATGPGGAGTVTSGTLTVTVTPPTTTCSTPAAGGTSTSWVDGTAESYTIACYSQGFASANAGNYPASITLNSGHPALRRHRGHLDLEFAGVHPVDLRIGRRPRSTSLDLQGHRDPDLERQRHLPRDLPGHRRRQRRAQRHLGHLDPHRHPAGSELGDRRHDRRQLLLGHQGSAVLLRHRGQRRPGRPHGTNPGSPVPCP